MIFRRPWPILILSLAVLVFSTTQAARALNGAAMWDFLMDVQLTVSPLYLVLTGLLWAVLGLRVAWWLWHGRILARAGLQVLAISYTLYYWIEQFLLMTSPLRRTNWPFMAVVSVLAIAAAFLVPALPAAAKFLGERDER
jgi:hypothetical protein